MHSQPEDNTTQDVRSRLLKMIMENEQKRHGEVTKGVIRR